ncbi:MAG TPA: DNA mismatch repair protein MutS [Methanomicrobiales archaeon]|nr:DNA mismatch repair protein MutS [Methanomicrobiales archaeon]
MAREGDTGVGEEQRLTPAMEQYRSFKDRFPDAILFFHIGDFYETFGADAELVSRELDIALTSRSRDRSGNRIPLAGVPRDAGPGYIARLVGKGYRVAVCDQVEDPSQARGIVRRAVVRVVTPGTVMDEDTAGQPGSRYLAGIWPDEKAGQAGLAFLDTATGEFFLSVVDTVGGPGDLRSEIARYRAAEAVVPPSLPGPLKELLVSEGIVITPLPEEAFGPERASRSLADHFGVGTLAGYGCDPYPAAVRAAGAVLAYAKETMNSPLGHVTGLSVRVPSDTMLLDAITLRNLEMFGNIRTGDRQGTLIGTLDATQTGMGRRELYRRLAAPLLSVEAINARLDAVEFFIGQAGTRRELRDLLGKCADIGRIAGRVACGSAGPRDLVALKELLGQVPRIRALFAREGSHVAPSIGAGLDALRDLPEVAALVARAIADNPPVLARQGNVIREGFSPELDGLRALSRNTKDWVVELQQREREATGIRSLRVGYNQVSGYYIEVTKPNLHLVPERYTRKQTTAGGERFITAELAEKGAQISSADEKILALEGQLYAGLVHSLEKEIPGFQATARGLADLDVASSLAEVARANGYTRPVPEQSLRLVIREGRHPVVERALGGRFVPNDTLMDGNGDQVLIITGANMAGKSTYMRGVALIAILAQAGSFVPAAHATVGIIDRVFTRVGAFDDLASGQSTFMVEMVELANILNSMTERSLVILDEIGKGTGTLDGYSIARSVLEFLHGKAAPGPRTLFATHFHEIVGVEAELKRVRNYHFTVKETGKEVVFLRRLVPGATDRSYGIHVARKAGVPRKVTDRAAEILISVQKGENGRGGRPKRYTQVLFVDAPEEDDREHPAVQELLDLKPDGMTPIQALEALYALQKRAREGGGREEKPDGS